MRNALALALLLASVVPAAAQVPGLPAGPQAAIDAESVVDGPCWHFTLFTTVGGQLSLDETGVFLEAIGKCWHPTLGRIIVYHYDSVYNCVGCAIEDPPGVGDRQVRVCWHEFVLPKFKNCNPPVRVMTPRWP